MLALKVSISYFLITGGSALSSDLLEGRVIRESYVRATRKEDGGDSSEPRRKSTEETK